MTVVLQPAYQALLQQLMASSALSENELKALVNEILPENVVLLDVIRKLSKSIEPYSLRVDKTVFNDGKTYYAIVNTSIDELSKYGNDFKPQQIMKLRKAIELILETEEGTISTTDLRNLRGEMSVYDMDQFLDRLVTEKWLSKHTRGFFTLGPRSFLELGQFLRESGMPSCPLCDYDVLIGLNCTNPSCAARLHVSCAEKRLAKGSTYKCAKCQEKIQLDNLLN